MSRFNQLNKDIISKVASGLLTVDVAKAQMETNRLACETLERMDAEDKLDRYSYTKTDVERDRCVDENFYVRWTRGSSKEDH